METTRLPSLRVGLAAAGLVAGTIGIFLTLFMLFLRFLPAFAMSEIKAVTPQVSPHGHGGHGHDGPHSNGVPHHGTHAAHAGRGH